MPHHFIPLASQIARIKSLDLDQIADIGREALAITEGWVAEYGQYQTGGWRTISLINNSGDPQDVIIRDCEPVATTVLHRSPATRQLLDRLKLKFMWARFARLSSNSFLWEHRDYHHLTPVGRSRLHIPILTNESAYMVIAGAKVHLRPGYIWRLTPTSPHGVCNVLGPDRIHLIIDCYIDNRFDRLNAQADLAAIDYEPLKELTLAERKKHLLKAHSLLRLGYRTAAEHYILRLFYHYNVPAGFVYDLLAELFELASLHVAASFWRAQKALLLRLNHAS